MRILLLTHTFNGLTQRLYVELTEARHELLVEFDINDQVTREAVALFMPHLILAPYLRRLIPDDIWRRQVCLVVHPGIVGDRGPSALDRAILRNEAQWGVTVLQTEAELDAGPVWAAVNFPMRPASKARGGPQPPPVHGQSLRLRILDLSVAQAAGEGLQNLLRERIAALRGVGFGRFASHRLRRCEPSPKLRFRSLA